MKRIFIAVITLLTINCAYAQVVREGNTFKTERTASKSDTIATKFFYEDKKGNKYSIVVNKKSGSCYVWKKSGKTGKMYKQYLNADICKVVCKELNIQYTPKKK